MQGIESGKPHRLKLSTSPSFPLSCRHFRGDTAQQRLDPAPPIGVRIAARLEVQNIAPDPLQITSSRQFDQGQDRFRF